jgi:hypothetical protein
MLSSSQTITSNKKEHVNIQLDDKINVVICQMMTAKEKKSK